MCVTVTLTIEEHVQRHGDTIAAVLGGVEMQPAPRSECSKSVDEAMPARNPVGDGRS
jgi:hypothetical protein